MNNLSKYLLEKLKLDKDIKVVDNTSAWPGEYSLIIPQTDKACDYFDNNFLDAQVYIDNDDLYGFIIDDNVLSDISEFSETDIRCFIIPEIYKDMKSFEHGLNSGDIGLNNLEEY